MKIKSSVLFLLSSVFLVSCDVQASEDPLAGEPEGERILATAKECGVAVIGFDEL